MKKAAEMTEQELVIAARNHDNVMNEGGDGYNPYNNELERRAAKSQAKAAAEYAATPRGKIDALYRRIDRECGSIAREWGDTEKIDALEASLYAEIDKIKAEMDAEFKKVWDVETTKNRRDEWNDFANSTLIPMSKAGKSVEMSRLMRGREKSQGWTLDDLRKAVKINKEIKS